MWVNLSGYEHHAYKPVLKASFQQPSYYFDLFNGFRMGPSINYVVRRGGRGLAKFLCCLCTKLAYGGGRESQKLAKSCLRSLWMPPILISGRIPAGSRTHDTFVFRANPHR